MGLLSKVVPTIICLKYFDSGICAVAIHQILVNFIYTENNGEEIINIILCINNFH